MTAPLPKMALPQLPQPNAPPPDMAKQLIGMSRLLQLEQEIRQASSVEVLSFIAVNDIYRVVPFDHAVFWQAKSSRITAVSGALKIEDTAAQIDWLTRLGAHLAEVGEVRLDVRGVGREPHGER